MEINHKKFNIDNALTQEIEDNINKVKMFKYYKHHLKQKMHFLF